MRVDLDVFTEAAGQAIAGLRDGTPGAARRAREARALAHQELLPEDRYASWAAGGRGRPHLLDVARTMLDELGVAPSPSVQQLRAELERPVAV